MRAHSSSHQTRTGPTSVNFSPLAAKTARPANTAGGLPNPVRSMTMREGWLGGYARDYHCCIASSFAQVRLVSAATEESLYYSHPRRMPPRGLASQARFCVNDEIGQICGVFAVVCSASFSVCAATRLGLSRPRDSCASSDDRAGPSWVRRSHSHVRSILEGAITNQASDVATSRLCSTPYNTVHTETWWLIVNNSAVDACRRNALPVSSHHCRFLVYCLALLFFLLFFPPSPSPPPSLLACVRRANGGPTQPN